MKKGRFGSIVLTISLLATGVLILTAIQGGHRDMFGDDATQTHVFLALIATLTLIFAHTWVALYLVSVGRQVRGFMESRGLEKDHGNFLESPHFLGWSAGALALLLVTFFLGPASLLGRVPTWLHTAFFVAATVVHLWSLVVEKRALQAREGHLLELSRLTGP